VTFQGELHPSPVPELSSPGAGDTLQILPTGFRSVSLIVMQLFPEGVQSFLWDASKKMRVTSSDMEQDKYGNAVIDL
jgi:hypothetical protein